MTEPATDGPDDGADRAARTEAADPVADAPGDTDDAYGGLFGAFPYAFRASESLVFKLYVVVGSLLAVLISVMFTIALIGVVARTTGGTGGVFTFSRTFFIVVGMLVVVPLIAPILLVARRHRKTGSTLRYDRTLAVAGVAFLASLYLGLVMSVPPEQQAATTSPVVRLLYDLPAVTGLVPPTTAGLGIYLLHRSLR